MATFMLNISCTICKAEFAKTDCIYSTSCGHVYHYTCIKQWKTQSKECAFCKFLNPTSFRIFLNFEDVKEDDLKVKIKADKNRIKELQDEIGKKDKKINNIKRLYIISEQWRAQLQDHIKKISDENKEENVKLSLKLGETEKLKSNETLTDEKKPDVSLENLSLREKLLQSEFLNADLNQKIKILEIKLDLITKELRERVKENVGLNKPETKPVTEENPTPSQAVNTSKRNRGRRGGHNNIDHLNTAASTQNKEVNGSKSDENNDKRIVIKDFPRKQLIPIITLKANIVLLASKMMLFLSENDIEQVNIAKQRHGLILNNISLIVTFANIEKKKEFISNANLLKFNESTKSILIKEFMDIDVYAVFKYANKKLRPKGFDFIYCKHNQIIVKKNRNDKNEITVKEKSDVDKILEVCAENGMLDKM